jgi:hypothetical protein
MMSFTKYVYNKNDQVKEDHIGRAYTTHGGEEEFMWDLVGKPKGKGPLGRCIRRCGG